jgi:uncharacterized repeat protein (TIGR03803 family)
MERSKIKKKRARRIRLAAAISFGVFGISAAQAYTLEKVYAYNQPAMQFNLLTQASDGKFYGTSATGEYGYGDVFQLTKFGDFTGIYDFMGSDGYHPLAGLVQANDSLLYGTTLYGSNATNGCGTVYKITTGGMRTALHNFSTKGTRGCNPSGELVQATDGALYGTTPNLGVNAQDLGTVYKVTSTGAFAEIYQFSGSDGSAPAGGLIQAGDGLLYGVTKLGGANGAGTVFNISTAGVLTKLHDFDGTDGSSPQTGLVDGGDGYFYGTATLGGTAPVPGGAGTVFKIAADGTFTKLHDFDRYNDGYQPNGLILAQDGALYGTTGFGGANNKGTLFKITTDGTFTKLYDFDGTTGKHPTTKLIQAADGALYGATAAAVFRVVGVPTATAPDLQMSLSNDTIPLGGYTSLTWTSSNAEHCNGTSPSSFAKGGLKTQGIKTIYDSSTAGGDFVYAMTCTGPGGSVNSSATLHVVPPAPTLTLSASPDPLPVNTTATLSWTTQYAASCVASGSWGGNKSHNGGSVGITKKSAGDYTYTLTCSNVTGSTSETVTITFQ